MEEKKVRAHVIISGRVQGVFFRANTVRAAQRIGVAGWVRNKRDGTVEAVFEGEEDKVNSVLVWCRTGDPPARVSDLQIDWEEFTGEFTEFSFTY